MPVPLRTDFDADAVRALARGTKDGPQARRLLALARFMTGHRAPRRPGSAGLGCRSCGTGS